MENKNTQNKGKNEALNAAGQPEKKPLLTPPQRSVLLGVAYAALLCGLTMLMDKIPVPSKDSTLWVLMAGFYILLVVISILLEKLIRKKTEMKRTLYYGTAQLIILAVVAILIATGVRTAGEEYYNSRELSYAMAFLFTEFVLLLYHLGRTIVLHILHSSEGQGAKQKKGKKKGKH